MRTLNRNKQTFYYALYEGTEEIKDEWGNLTGESEVKYSKPLRMMANISPARGESGADMFGVSLDYDRTIVTANMNCPIIETSILWIDTMPKIKADGSTDTPHDYTVKRVGSSINGITYAVKKVDVS